MGYRSPRSSPHPEDRRLVTTRESAPEHFNNARAILWTLRDLLGTMDLSIEARRVVTDDVNAADARIAAGLAELARNAQQHRHAEATRG